MADLDMLKEMGFDPEKASLALQKGGGNLQGAIDWLEKNQDKSMEELKEGENEEQNEDSNEVNIPAGESAKSLLCKECGKKFRSQAQAEFHASKTEHVDFEESTDEIAPLTEEEKKARLDELRQKLALKRAEESEKDKINNKRNDEIKRKHTIEAQDIKEDLQKKEQIKDAEKKRQEKVADAEAKRRVKAKIEEDREARRLKAEQEKAARSGSMISPVAAAPVETTSIPSKPKSASDYTEARLRLTTPTGMLTKTLPVETTLFELASIVENESGQAVSFFTTNFPKKTFKQEDFGQTLKEAGMVPSAALIVG